MRAAVTGGAGALGSALTKLLLKKGWEVTIFEILQPDVAWRLSEILDEVSYHWKSINDVTRDDLKNFDLICHCAAQPDRPFGITSPHTTMWTNIMGLTRVLEAVKRQPPEKFLFPGSGTTFTGLPEDELPATESTIPRPTNPYSASKYMAETLCRTYLRCYRIPVTILRSGMVYGEGMRLDISIAQFIIKALTFGAVSVRSPNATRTPTHISDVLLYWESIIDASPQDVVGQTFHSVFGKEYSIIEIAQTVCKLLGVDEIFTLPYEPGEQIAGKPVREWIISTKDSLLNVSPSIDLEEGLTRTIPYIRRRLKRLGG